MVNGITFDQQLITSANMAHFMWTFAGKKSGITRGCDLSVSGSTLYISPGYILSHGRMTQIVGTESIEAPSVTSGSLYARLVYRIDLTMENSETEFTQGFFEVLTSATGYPTITQEDIDADGTTFDLPFARFMITSSGISGLVDESVKFDTSTYITLAANGWTQSGSVYVQTASVDTITAASMPSQAIVYPEGCTDSQRKAIQKNSSFITKIETDDGSITFTATRRPAVDLQLALKV